jgi:hypothetical protein
MLGQQEEIKIILKKLAEVTYDKFIKDLRDGKLNISKNKLLSAYASGKTNKKN